MSCEWVAVTKDIVIAISAATAAVIAFKGLGTWQKELKGKSEYQLAKDVLRSVYKVREAFKIIRNPMIMSYEYPEEMRSHTGHLNEENRHEGTLHVYEERWKPMTDAFKELEDKNLEALVEWGSKYQDTIVPLRKCRAELLMATQDMLARYKNPHNDTWKNREEKAQEKSVLYHMGENSEFDKFTPDINAAIELFEQWLRPHISRNH
jgi:hypothetical protein